MSRATRSPRPSREQLELHQALAATLVPVAFRVIAGPPGCDPYDVRFMTPAEAAVALARGREEARDE